MTAPSKDALYNLLLEEYDEIKAKMLHSTALKKQLRYLEISQALFGLTEPEAQRDLADLKRFNRNTLIQEKGWYANKPALPDATKGK